VHYADTRRVANSTSDSESESITSNASEDCIVIVPTERSSADGYNASKTPTGNVVTSASGQVIEFFEGVHHPEVVKQPNQGGRGQRQRQQGYRQHSYN